MKQGKCPHSVQYYTMYILTPYHIDVQVIHIFLTPAGSKSLGKFGTDNTSGKKALKRKHQRQRIVNRTYVSSEKTNQARRSRTHSTHVIS